MPRKPHKDSYLHLEEHNGKKHYFYRRTLPVRIAAISHPSYTKSGKLRKHIIVVSLKTSRQKLAKDLLPDVNIRFDAAVDSWDWQVSNFKDPVWTFSITDLLPTEIDKIVANRQLKKQSLSVIGDIDDTLSDLRTCAPPTAPAPIKTIETTVEHYFNTKVFKNKKTKSGYRASINRLFMLVDKNMPISDFTFEYCRDTLQALIRSEWIDQDNPKTFGGAQQKLIRIRTVFNWLLKNKYMTENPIAAIDRIDHRDPSVLTKNFSKDDVYNIFQSDFFQKELYLEPYLYWISVLFAVFGNRLNETSQLHCDDINLTALIPYIQFTDAGSDTKSIKNTESRRCVPIPSGLEKLGFNRWIANLKARGQVRVFEELKYSETGGYARYPSDNLNDFLKIIGVHEKQTKTIESFRGTVKSIMMDCDDIPHHIIDQIQGHSEFTLPMHRRYAGPRDLPKMIEHVEKLPVPDVPVFKFVDTALDYEEILRIKAIKNKQIKPFKSYPFRKAGGKLVSSWDEYKHYNNIK